jgi:hypothetical protein
MNPGTRRLPFERRTLSGCSSCRGARADEGGASSTLYDGDFEVPAECFDVLLQHVDRDVVGSFDRGDPRLRDTDSPGKLALRHASDLAQRCQPGGEAKLVFDLTNPLLGTRHCKDLLLPLLDAHRFDPFPFFADFPIVPRRFAARLA